MVRIEATPSPAMLLSDLVVIKGRPNFQDRPRPEFATDLKGTIIEQINSPEPPKFNADPASLYSVDSSAKGFGLLAPQLKQQASKPMPVQISE